MHTFFKKLRGIQGRRPRRQDARRRTWVFAPYDQLTDRAGPLATVDPADVGLILIENPQKATRRPYHKQKLAYILGNQRQFALEQAERGVAVRYEVGRYADVLRTLAHELGQSIRVMRPAEREMRRETALALPDETLVEIPNTLWLTTAEDFAAGSNKTPPWRMDVFYRNVRKRTGVLMDQAGKPFGGKFSFDTDNRKPWRSGLDPEPPTPLTFHHDPIIAEVVDLIERDYAHHPGRLDAASVPTRQEDATALWRWAKEQCLPNFGPYEDAMTRHSRGIFHTRVSPLLNIGRLIPQDLIQDTAELDIPLASQEGFIRQVLGWREFMHHVHDATDGFRENLPNGRAAVRSSPGDGGFGRWRGEPWKVDREPASAGASPNYLDAHVDLPPAFWGQTCGLHCLDTVVGDVLHDGYSHHITRLMVLANLATLLGIEPRQVTDWFWCVYIDAFDWVVEPNVLGMGTFALGELFTTKPYVSGAAYIDRMSDYCGSCAFHPKKTCPITRLYWAFLARHAEHFAGNRRLSLPLRNVAKRKESERREDARVLVKVNQLLARGEQLTPEKLARP